MSYLLDRKAKQKKIYYFLFAVIGAGVLFYFWSNIWGGFSFLSQSVFRPIFSLRNDISQKFENFSAYFFTKQALYLENQELRSRLSENTARIADYDSILAENLSLKEILGRKDAKVEMVLSAILSKPNVSPYDILIIDVGIEAGIQVEDKVFALGNVPIGKVASVFARSAKVVLFSTAGEKTQVAVGNENIHMEIVGRGGGNFEMILPRDFVLQKGDQVVLPGLSSEVVGIVETIISDPRDPFIKALLVSPVNIQELKFVQVELRR